MKLRRMLVTVLATISCAGLLAGCSESKQDLDSYLETEAGQRETNYEYLTPEAAGTVVYAENDISIDASNANQGYVMVRCTGESEDGASVWVQIEDPYGTLFTYALTIGDYETFPFSSGDGMYNVSVLKEVEAEMYALMLSTDIDVKLESEFLPFLYPNQYVGYQAGDSIVSLSCELSEQSSSDLDYLRQVYHYIIDNVEYDKELAENVEVGYVPDGNRTIETKKGICFDYASLMAALLRAQNIPAKLVVRYAGTDYHAWISVYIDEMGWLDNVIQFDGASWSIMDPTMAASNDEDTVRKYTTEEEGYYLAKYNY